MSTHALAGSRVLVVGAGAIGEAIRLCLAPFETEIVQAVTIARNDEHGHIHDIDGLPELPPDTDALMLIVPLTDSTRGLIGAKELALLPNGALMISVARGPVVNADVITAEVVTDRLWMAPNVLNPKPFSDDHPLWRADGAFTSPHIGGNTTAILPRIAALLTDRLSRLADGRESKFVVKPRVTPRLGPTRLSDYGSPTTT